MFFVRYFVSNTSFAIIMIGKRELVVLFTFLVSRDCCVALSHGATGLSTVCDCCLTRIDIK